MNDIEITKKRQVFNFFENPGRPLDWHFDLKLAENPGLDSSHLCGALSESMKRVRIKASVRGGDIFFDGKALEDYVIMIHELQSPDCGQHFRCLENYYSAPVQKKPEKMKTPKFQKNSITLVL